MGYGAGVPVSIGSRHYAEPRDNEPQAPAYHERLHPLAAPQPGPSVNVLPDCNTCPVLHACQTRPPLAPFLRPECEVPLAKRKYMIRADNPYSPEARRQNRAAILAELRRLRQADSATIAEATGLSYNCVRGIVRHLLDDGDVRLVQASIRGHTRHVYAANEEQQP